MANTSKTPKANVPRRTAILICGMHRSGTSALAGALRLLGVAAPKTLVPAHPSNPRGHWESAPLVDLFETMLADAGSSHLDWRAIDHEWFNSDRANRYRQSIKNVILSEFEGSPLFFIKDPRICRFMPFMIETVQELKIQSHIVLPLRNPLEVANSLARRNGLPIAESLLIWLRHVLEAEYHSRSFPRFFLEYQMLISDWRTTLKPLYGEIGLKWPSSEPVSHQKVDGFLERDLRHENISLNELQIHDSTPVWVKEAYRCLVGLSQGKREETLLNDLSDLRSDFDIACKAFDLNQNGQLHQSGDEQLNSGGPKLDSQVLNYSRVVSERDDEVQRLTTEINNRDQRLVAANEELVRVTARADSDLRRAIGEIESYNQRLLLAGDEVQRLTTEVNNRDQRLVAANEELVRVAAKADADLRHAIGEIEGYNQRLVLAGEDVQRLTTEVNNRDQRLVALNEELVRVTAQADRELRRAIGEIESYNQRLVLAGEEVGRLTTEVNDRDRRLVAANEELVRFAAKADADLRRAIGEIEGYNQRLVLAAGEVRRLTTEVGNRDQRLVAANEELVQVAAKADSDLRRVIGEIESCNQQIITADEEVRRLIAELHIRDQQIAAAQAAMDERDRHLAVTTRALNTATEEAEELERRRMILKQRLHEIETSIIWRTTTRVRSLFSGQHPRPKT